MAVNDFSAVTSDFVQTALAWTHPACLIHRGYMYIGTPVHDFETDACRDAQVWR